MYTGYMLVHVIEGNIKMQCFAYIYIYMYMYMMYSTCAMYMYMCEDYCTTILLYYVQCTCMYTCTRVHVQGVYTVPGVPGATGVLWSSAIIMPGVSSLSVRGGR